MQKRTLVYTATLAAILAGGLGSAAMADRMRDHGGMGPMGMMMQDGPMFDFDKVDTDKDGKITPEEFAAARAARIAELDADKDGKISTDELVAMRMRGAEDRIRAQVGQMMQRMDADGDGVLTAAEVLAMPGPGPQMLARVDTDGDGAVSKAEAEAARDRMMARMGDHGQGRSHRDHGKGGHGKDGHGKGGHGQKGQGGMGQGGKPMMPPPEEGAGN
ncbi:calcium-binding protein [Gemmobacter lutimaris]|uniref:Calcium-binding protein n=1 Tax=Gemmobacter lutimaris TaxID=2306023 RepID=A0A398BWY9_9RHOB|nr:EF-hand domain-containing protein [Gemmobacter lutimaris]RID91813.1 calcium-binding protein [Gemmobacter lutimaris]